MAEMPKTAAQQQADLQGCLLAQEFLERRSQLQAMLTARPGLCTSEGLRVNPEFLNGDFDLDDPVVRQLLRGGLPGTTLRAAPPAAMMSPRPNAPADERSALDRYLRPDGPAAAPGTVERFNRELRSATYGPTNVLANSMAAGAGVARAAGELGIATRLRSGIERVSGGQASTVRLSPHMELYNAAGPRQNPRPRLRVRNLPLAVVQAAVPTRGGPHTSWRPNPAANGYTLPARSMTDQRAAQVATLGAERGLPRWLQFTQGRMVGGVLTFGPSAMLDLYNATEVDIRRRNLSFDREQFAVDSARSQSGNLLGFAVGASAVMFLAGGAVVTAPVLLIGLGAGITAQVVWNSFGGGDAAAEQMRRVLN